MKKVYNIDIGSIWHTNYSGDIEVLEDLGFEDFYDRRRRYKIRFINTNHEKIVRHDSIVSGSIKDEIPCIDFDKIRKSKTCEDYQIIEYIGIINGRQYVKIRFVNSLSESIVLLTHAESGSVHDPMFGFNPNKIFQSNRSGPFKMLEYLGKHNGHAFVKIQFLDTGYIRDVQMYNAIDGKVSDPTLNGKTSKNFSMDRFDDYDAYIVKRLKSIYSKMIDRCTNKNTKEYVYYGALGISVCDRWMESFDNFLEDVKHLPGYEKFYQKPFMYQLDKDYLQFNLPREIRIYSPETCMFLSNQDNINLMTIEYKKYNPGCGYYGIDINNAGNFQVGIRINGKFIYLGCFDDIIAAANMYNMAFLWYHQYELIPVLNDVPYMPPNEIFKHKINPKMMYHLINN